MKKRAIRKIARRIAATGGAALFMGAVIAPTITPTITMAAETQGLADAIEEAENTPHLTIEKETETITVKKAQEETKRAEIEALEKEEENKVRTAIDEQKRKNEEYESKANDPDYILDSHLNGFDKEDIIDLLTTNGEFNYADITQLAFEGGQLEIDASKALTEEQKAEYLQIIDNSTLSENIKNEHRDRINRNWVYNLSVGDTFTVKNDKLVDAKTGRQFDVKFTLKDIEKSETTDYLPELDSTICVYDNASWLVIINMLSTQNTNWDMEFIDSETGEKVELDVLLPIIDIDDMQFIDIDFDNSILGNPTNVEKNETTYTSEVINDPTDNPEGMAIGVKRGVDTINFTWGLQRQLQNPSFSASFYKSIELNFNEPELRTTSVEVTEYELVVEPNDENATFNFIDTEDNTVADSINKTGVDNDTIPIDDVNSAVAELEANGYEVVTNPVTNNLKYDEDPTVDQEFTVVVKPIIETITSDNPKDEGDPTTADNVTYPKGVDKDSLNKTYTRTIYYKYINENGEDVIEPVVQTATITRTATFNYVTGEVTYSDWTTATFDNVDSPTIDNYTYDKSAIPSVAATKDMTEYVIYNKIPQKGSVTFTDGTNDLADKVLLDGYNEEPVDYNPNNTIDTIENLGWDVVYNDFPDAPVFDTDSEVDQDYVITFAPHIETITSNNPKKSGDPTDRSEVTYPDGVDKDDLSKTITRTITYVDEDGNEMSEPVIQTATLTRTATFNYVTGAVEYSDWTTDSMDEVISPGIDNYTKNKESIPKIDIISDMDDINEVVTYKKIPQKGTVTYEDGDTELEVDELNGFNAEIIDYSTKDKINDYINKGYDLIEDGFSEDATFDTDTETDQNFSVKLKPHIETITCDNPKNEGDKTDRENVVYSKGLSEADLTKTVKRTIKYVYEDGSEASKPVIQEVKLTRTATFNYVTGEIIYSDWTTSSVEAVESPSIANYTPDKETVNSAELNATGGDLEEIVTYKAETITEPYDTSIDDPIYTQTYNEDYTDNVTDEPTIPSNITQDTTVASDTGDKSNIGLFAGIAAGALAGIGAMVAKIRKREE